MELVSKAEFQKRLRQPHPAVDPPKQEVTLTMSQSSFGSRIAADPARPPTIRELRGEGGIANIKPSRNMADSPSQLSIAVAPGANRPEHAARSLCDMTRHAEVSLTLSKESPFMKEHCSTKKGWTKGVFS